MYKPWNFQYLSENLNITWEIVRDNPDKHWDFSFLSFNSNITWEIVRDNPDKPWNFSYLSKNPNITWEIVRDNVYKPWNYFLLSTNPNITWEIVRDNPDKPWSYYNLINNRNITWEIFRDNTSKPLYIDYNTLYTKVIFRFYNQPISQQKRNMLNILKNNKNMKDFCFTLIRFNKKHKEFEKEILETITWFKIYVTEELMSFVWHPSRFHIWKNLDEDFNTF